MRSLNLYLATLTGFVPSHSIRFLLYTRVFGIDVPADSIIYWKARFFKPSGIRIGHTTIIGNDAFLDGRFGVFIGDNVNIGMEVRIFTAEHDVSSPEFGNAEGAVKIDDLVYIGSRVTILPDVHIGKGAVVASGAVVTKDVPPWTMVGGVPAQFIKKRPVVQYTLNTKDRMLFQ